MAPTAAYNANEVATVYMSLNRDDLLSTDEGGSKMDSSESLKNGFYALSDPMNSRGLLESFEANFERGPDKSTYKIRILNPTTELESILIGFYQNVFPSNQSTFEKFADDDARTKRMEDVERVTGDKDISFLSNNAPPALPIIYLRWGYGTDEQSGLSRIHKAMMAGMKYIVTTDKDKVIELSCQDRYTFNKSNPTFNKRPYVSRVNVGDLVNGEPSLRKPSHILTELFARYASAYPACIPIVDLGDYTEPFDNLVYSVAYSLAESDKLTKEKKKAAADAAKEGEEPEEIASVGVDSTTQLTSAEIKAIEDMVDRPITSDQAIDRGVKGIVTQQILYQAYKLVFQQLGLNWEINPIDSPDSINGPPAENQTSPDNIPEGKTASQTLKFTVDSNDAKVTSEQLVNIKSELLDEKVFWGDTVLYDRDTNMLSFWPMALETPPIPDPYDVPGLVLGTIVDVQSVATLHVTKSWDGVAPTDCATYNSTLGTDGCGTGTAPPEPAQETQLQAGTVVQFSDSAETIRQNTSPILRSYFIDEDVRSYLTEGATPPSITPVQDEYDIDTETWHPPQWYSWNATESTAQNIEPRKVLFKNIQGAIELNDKEFYLYDTDPLGNTNGSKFFLLEGIPNPDGSINLEHFNHEMDGDAVSPYEQGGEIWDPEAVILPGPAAPDTKLVRPLTLDEKLLIQEKGIAPIWVNAGLVNPNNYKIGGFKDEDALIKYVFMLKDLAAKFDVGDSVDSEMALHQGYGNSYQNPVEVSIPVITSHNTGTKLYTGDHHETQEPPAPVGVPLIDLSTMDYYPVADYSSLPEGEFKVWAQYAQEEIYDFLGTDDTGIIPDMAENPPLLLLEPTPDTSSWGLFCAFTYEQLMANELAAAKAAEEQEAIDAAAAAEPAPPPVETITVNPGKWAKKAALHSGGYVSMGDGSQTPHISRFLETIINNVNRLIIGRSSKMMVQPIQVNSLSEADRKILAAECKSVLGYKWNDAWVEQDNVILVIGPSDEIKAQWCDPIIRPVRSFPQATTSGIPQVLWLTYGDPNSLVAKVDFTGDVRVLVNLAQSNYAARQWNDVKQLFDGQTTLSESLITNVISEGLANKIADLTTKNALSEGLTEGEQSSLDKYKELQNLVNTTQSDNGQMTDGSSDALIHSELLEIFPDLVASFQTDAALDKVVGQNSAKDMRVLASLMSNPFTLNWMFPDAQIDGNTNEKTAQIITVTRENVVKKDISLKILQRKIDFTALRSRIGVLDVQNKLSDVSFNFQTAMSQETFTVQLTTLGIPEIDNPSQEFLSRLIMFKYYDPRLASNSQHWLSGVYQLTGFKHKLTPGQGYLTELSLLRNNAYNILATTQPE